MRREIIELYDRYTHSLLDRRTFLESLAVWAGGAAAAQALLPLLENDYASAAMVAEDDPRIDASFVTYPGAGMEMRGYLAIPKAGAAGGAGAEGSAAGEMATGGGRADEPATGGSVDGGAKVPAVVVIHENRGLNPHIQDVVRRLAAVGYLALGPDALTASGGTPADEDQAREEISKLDAVKTRENFVRSVAWLQQHPRSSGKVGCVGFCWGGAMANQLAVHVPELSAAVAFYGRVPVLEDVPKIHAPLLLHYAGRDERINADVPAYRAALEKAKKEFAIYMYDDVDHAFHNDTNAARYNEAAAKLAWSRTLEFFASKLT
ncbi:MAG: dienelactone hydrolase family protein [Candidatus Eisenbacteria bacterium]|uniref:Dienelactone hydrolase family protein n=1 Tax=Eiseniibacteriota bacterium TaxID=2212470 RepID=A0A956RNT2_UNCEI|nr:dienelactone hydrolase family protein [Candidatus Eisenbacteria bacterium]